MTILQAIVLGIVQGATEFIPVSSSGHLVLAPYFLGWDIPEKEAFIFDVLVQVATLVAVLVYFKADLSSILRATWKATQDGWRAPSQQAQMGLLLVLASLPAGFFGLLLKVSLERAFNDPRTTAIFLFGTAGLLLIGERLGRRIRGLDNLNWKDALWIGAFQVLALYPGISRSGATLAGGMTRNLERPASARFSFLMAVPIMLAAGLAALYDLAGSAYTADSLLPLLAGCLTSGIVGYLAIRWLLGFLARHPLYVFAAYCSALGLVTLLSLPG